MMNYLVLSLHHFDPGVYGFNPVAGIFPPVVQLNRDGLGIKNAPTGEDNAEQLTDLSTGTTVCETGSIVQWMLH